MSSESFVNKILNM
ncbi:unnamed protein product, partial [Rotaria sp. Silwood1]